MTHYNTIRDALEAGFYPRLTDGTPSTARQDALTAPRTATPRE